MFKAAVIVDAQEDFMDPFGALYIPMSENIIPTLNSYLERTLIFSKSIK